MRARAHTLTHTSRAGPLSMARSSATHGCASLAFPSPMSFTDARDTQAQTHARAHTTRAHAHTRMRSLCCCCCTAAAGRDLSLDCRRLQSQTPAHEGATSGTALHRPKMEEDSVIGVLQLEPRLSLYPFPALYPIFFFIL